MAEHNLQNSLDDLATLISSRVVAQLSQPTNELSMTDARHILFHGKSPSWIKYYLIGKHPEILAENGGWITRPQGTGKPIKVINVLQAKQWMANAKIDWYSPEPITIVRRLSKKEGK